MRFNILLFLVFSAHYVCGQTLSKKYVDAWVMKCDTTVKSEKINSYIIQGKVYLRPDSLKLDSLLITIPFARLLNIDFFRTEELVETTGVAGQIVIFIQFKGTQSKTVKNELLKKAVAIYDGTLIRTSQIPRNSKKPVLLINNQQIFNSNCYRELMKIKASEIYAISINKKAVPWEYCGQSAKNGLIQIWTVHNNE